MLILTRKSHEQIQIGDNITITILRMKGKGVQVGIDAPKSMTVLRKELCHRRAAAEVTVQADAIEEDVTPAPAADKRPASRLPGGKQRSALSQPSANPLRTSAVGCPSAPLKRFVAARV